MGNYLYRVIIIQALRVLAALAFGLLSMTARAAATAEIQIDGSQRISGLELTTGDAPTQITEGQVVVTVSGTFARKDWVLTSEAYGQIVPNSGGIFSIQLPMEENDQTFEILSVSPDGDIEKQALRIHVPDFKSLRSDAEKTGEKAVSAIEAIYPKGRILAQRKPLIFIWRRMKNAKSYEASLIVLEQGKEQEVATVTVDSKHPTQSELGGVLLPGEYRWKVRATGPNHENLSEAAQEFRVEAQGFKPEESGVLGAAYLLSQMNYASSNTAFAADFNAGMAGPSFFASLNLAKYFSVEAIYRRMDFNVTGENLRNEAINAGAYYISNPFKMFKKHDFLFSGGLRGGYNSVPEVVADSTSTVLNAQLTQWIINPVLRLNYLFDEQVTFIASIDGTYPLAMSSGRLGPATLQGFPLSIGANIGAGLRVSAAWGARADFRYYSTSATYQAGGDTISMSMYGYQFLMGLLYFY